MIMDYIALALTDNLRLSLNFMIELLTLSVWVVFGSNQVYLHAIGSHNLIDSVAQLS